MGDLAITDLLLGGNVHAKGELHARARISSKLFGSPIPALRIGRYELGETLGTGGCAVVVRARDPQLERDLAVKLARRDLGGNEAETRARLQREAQAIARLGHHPNIVEVFDAGTIDDDGALIVFVAMELVEGGTLRDWLVARPRTCSDIVEIFVQAGRGLAHAHAHGIVHRDFKPSNVLVTHDGRAKVADFGLAQVGAADSVPTEKGLDRDTDVSLSIHAVVGSSTSDARSMTRTGTIVGTPAFMAPEQHLGLQVDARSDQFAFAVALYQALFGALPFAGDTVDTLRSTVLTQRARCPGDRRVPGAIRRALVRALSRWPEERFADMAALLAALRPGRRRWIALPMIATAVLAGSLAARAEEPSDCVRLARERHAAWNDDVRAQIASAFTATGLGFADEARNRVVDGAQVWFDAWDTELARACTTDDRVEVPTRCLDDGLARARASIELFVDADVVVVERAAAAIESWPALDECTTPAAVDDRRELSREAEALVAKSDAAYMGGRYDRAQEAANAALLLAPAEAERVTAQAHMQLGRALLQLDREDQAMAELEAAMWGASAIGDDRTAVLALLELGRERAERLDSAGAQAHLRQAEAHATRLDDREISVRVFAQQADAANLQDDLETASRAIEAARETMRVGPVSGITEAALWIAAADLALGRGDIPGAIEHSEHSLELILRERGANHPDVIAAHERVGFNLAQAGRDAEGVRHLERAAEIAERCYGPAHPRTASVIANLATAIRDDDVHRALPLYARAERLLAAREPEQPLLAVLNNHAAALYQVQRYEDAAERLVDARTLSERLDPSDTIRLAAIDTNLAHVHTDTGRWDLVASHAGAAYAVFRVRLGERHPSGIKALLQIGTAQAHLGEATRGIETLTAALSIADAVLGADHDTMGLLHYRLGEAYRIAGDDERALDALNHALATFGRTGTGQPPHGRAYLHKAELLFARGDLHGAEQSAAAAIALLATPAVASDRALAQEVLQRAPVTLHAVGRSPARAACRRAAPG